MRSGSHDVKSIVASEESIGIHEHAEMPREDGPQHGDQALPDHVEDERIMIK